LFVADSNGDRPCHGGEPRYAGDPNFRELVLFYEHFHGDTGRGLGASHQTGWTALASRVLEMSAKARAGAAARDPRATDAPAAPIPAPVPPAPVPAGSPPAAVPGSAVHASRR
jgi:hypothetical protein